MKLHDVINTAGRRYVIADIRPIKRGKLAGRFEYTLAPIDSRDKPKKYRSPLNYLDAVATAAEVQAALKRYQEATSGEAAPRVGRDLRRLSRLGYKDGFDVYLEFATGPAWKATEKANEQGRVLVELGDGRQKWVAGRHVKDVRWPTASCPVRDFSEAEWEELCARGWTQVGDYIVMVLGGAASTVTWLDGKPMVGRYDKTLKVFWWNETEVQNDARDGTDVGSGLGLVGGSETVAG